LAPFISEHLSIINTYLRNIYKQSISIMIKLRMENVDEKT